MKKPTLPTRSLALLNAIARELEVEPIEALVQAIDLKHEQVQAAKARKERAAKELENIEAVLALQFPDAAPRPEEPSPEAGLFSGMGESHLALVPWAAALEGMFDRPDPVPGGEDARRATLRRRSWPSWGVSQDVRYPQGSSRPEAQSPSSEGVGPFLWEA